MDFFARLFDASGFVPRRVCGDWSTELILLHNISDGLIWLSYLAIPVVLIYFIRRRRDIPFPWIFWLFGAFIILCGTTHLMEVVLFYWPSYRLAGLIKLGTAIASVSTVIALVPITPLALAMRTPRELEREIAERRRVEEALRENEERFRGTFENAAVGIAHTDDRGRFLRVNETFCEIVGYARAELLGRTFADITHPDDLAESLDRYTSLMRGETSRYTQEKRYIRQDGSTVWGEVTVSLQHDMAGSANYAIAILQDISERKQAEEALRLANARLDLATRGSNIGIWELDMPDGVFRNGRVDFMNILEQLGHDRDELPNAYESRIALVHPDDRAPFEQTLQGYLDGETRELEIEHRARHKDGSFRWMLTRGVDMRDPEGRPIRLIGSSIDITDHRRAQEALRESEGRFRGTFENAAVGIAQKDADGRFLRVNEKYCQIVGYSRDELLQRTFQEITHPDDLAAELERYTPLMRGDLSSYSLEKRYLRQDGSLIWIDLSVSLQRDAAGRPDYAIAILQDISQRKRLEEETRRAMETAEAANRAKDEFLANVSHEIRTPLNAVLGMTDLVLDTPLTDDQRQCLDTVKSAGESLLSVIADLLDFSKIAAGKLELDPAEFFLRAQIGDTLRALATRAHGKRLELAWHVQPDVPDALVGDAGRLRQVLLNLVGNAIKFTDRGEVVVRVEVRRRIARRRGRPALLGARHRHRHLARQSGQDLPRLRAGGHLDHAEVRRHRPGPDDRRAAGGPDGRQDRRGERAGRGSTFTFTARFGRQPQPSTSIDARSSHLFRELPVLVVNDNATNRHILEAWLRGWQMEPTAVADGAAAMDALWHGLALNRPYAMVLLDSCMPGTSGLALAAMIRERAELAATRVILLSSGDPAGDRARSRELHIDAHLLKPVPPDELLATIYRVMSRADGHASPTRQAAIESAPAVERLHILVAEDNEFNMRHLERLLVRRGHSVRPAYNGREALALLAMGEGPAVGGENETASSFAPPFDLLLLDVHMPELDGFQVISKIREREQAAGYHLPVIALTARSRREDRERCLAAGMDEYLAKPIRAADLFAAIDRLVSRPGARQPGQTEPADGASLLDPLVLLAACGDDPDGLRGLCEDFSAYTPKRLADVNDALRNQDAPRLREAAHKLRSLLATFSTLAGELASQLEDHAALGHLDEARHLVKRIEDMTSRLIGQVDGLSYERVRQQAEAANGPGRTGGG